MSFFQQILEAFESLASNKLRSGLTMLGIVIGVAAVISMLAIGNGAQASINNSINSIGTNLMFVSAGGRNIQNPKPLTTEDVAAIADPAQAPSVLAVAPTLQGRIQASYNGQSENTQVVGVTPTYATLRDLALTEGNFISDTDQSERAAVVVLGPTVATNIFGRTDNLVGQTLRLGTQPFRVIGVLESKGGTGFGNADDQVFVPMTTAQSRLIVRKQRDAVDQVMVQAASADLVNTASNEVTAILEARHKITTGVDDFTILKQQDILNSASSITGTLTLFLGGIAGISLLVGGIGIMNIMLVSVTERTKEIGLRKALGARRRDILIQFLFESASISLLGGIFGIILAWGITVLVANFAASSGTALNPIINASSVLMATLFSAAVGLFFGIYPANRAARLAPVEALRTE
jgi:putative ABC transport system permease protein